MPYTVGDADCLSTAVKTKDRSVFSLVWTCAYTVAPTPLFNRIHPGHCLLTSKLTDKASLMIVTTKLDSTEQETIDHTNIHYTQGRKESTLKAKISTWRQVNF